MLFASLEDTGIPIAVTVALSLAAFCVTMAPMLVALYRGHPSWLGIGVLCFFLSWTCIGWIIGLIWSCSSVGQPATTVIVNGGRRRRFD